MLWDNIKWSEAKTFLFDGINSVGKKIKRYLMQVLEQHFSCSNQDTICQNKNSYTCQNDLVPLPKTQKTRSCGLTLSADYSSLA